MARKRISQSDIIGDQGIALIHQIVSGMGLLWHPTGGVEAGTDGFIEIRDPATGEVSACFLPVQSRATSKQFQAESNDGFDYLCDERDLEYWLAGNAPVILVRSRPSTNEAYWVSVKDYFREPERREKRTVHFRKNENRFDKNCRDALIRLAVPKDSGLYLSPLPKTELLYSNLLKVESNPKTLYRAKTRYRTEKGLWAEFKRRNLTMPGEWMLKSKEIISFHNLAQEPWPNFCTAASVRNDETSKWASSDDPVTQRDFVQLLRRCLREKLWRRGVKFHARRRYYFFRAPPDLSTLEVRYQSLSEETSREVFRVYYRKNDLEKISRCRHSAFEGRFLRYGGEWFLEITPTYHFTWDGFQLSRFADEFLKKIKQFEKNPAVLGQILMWVSYLTESDLYEQPYPFLTFGELQTFELERGVNDSAWLPAEEDSAAPRLADETFPLFE